MSSLKVGRACSRASCRRMATMTLTYIYAESVAVVGPLATYSEPHAYDLCEIHAERLTVPNGWEVIRAAITDNQSGPSDDDLMAIADAVREVASAPIAEKNSSSATLAASSEHIGRRGHLRAVPNK
ncbi:unannotated protein [freshwater metagenome]|uniref:Unannotated protein n=1 Tax=freshwater metagenome TaxID=449393 RepID=A0A6J6GKX5_9ZZZZ|nr:DUF3499 family protein [Actinomycetota bacterium]